MKIRKKLVLSVSMIFIALFVSTNSSALTTYIVVYPETVQLGELFTINLIFDYELDCNCLYSDRAHFYWSVNEEYVIMTAGVSKLLYNLENYPRPTNVSFTFDSAVFAYSSLATGDIIRFRLKFETGYELNNIIYFEGIIRTPTYEITIGEAVTDKTSAGIITSMFVLAAIVIFTRKRKVDPYA